MRFLFKAVWDVEASNAAIKEGRMGEIVESILADLKPEAVYFVAENGKRAAYIILDMQDTSQMPAIAEPWFLAFNAAVELIPVMVPEDLMKAGPAIEEAVKKYG